MDDDCRHGIAGSDCATCRAATHTARSESDRIGHEKLLIHCPAIASDSLLHFNRQGESYRLRAYVGDLAGRPAWYQEDAPTATEFLRTYAPSIHVDVAADGIRVERTDRWVEIITAHNRRLGIGG